MNTAKPQSERCTTSASKESGPTTDRSISRVEDDGITDHETKCLRRGSTFLYYRGPFRVYFNRKEEAPRVISIDNGSHAWEIVCKKVDIFGIVLTSEIKLGAEYPDPAFALTGEGAVYVDANGTAVIR